MEYLLKVWDLVGEARDIYREHNKEVAEPCIAKSLNNESEKYVYLYPKMNKLKNV